MILEFSEANWGISLSAGGQLEHPSEVNSSRTAKDWSIAPVEAVSVLWEPFFLTIPKTARPETAIINIHFIHASYEIELSEMSAT
jgi:hypothetical protein